MFLFAVLLFLWPKTISLRWFYTYCPRHAVNSVNMTSERAGIAFPLLHSLSVLNKAFHLQMTQGGAPHPFNCVVLIPVKSTHFSKCIPG